MARCLWRLMMAPPRSGWQIPAAVIRLHYAIAPSTMGLSSIPGTFSQFIRAFRAPPESSSFSIMHLQHCSPSIASAWRLLQRNPPHLMVARVVNANLGSPKVRAEKFRRLLDPTGGVGMNDLNGVCSNSQLFHKVSLRTQRIGQHHFRNLFAALMRTGKTEKVSINCHFAAHPEAPT